MSRILEFIKDGYHASFEILRGQRRQLITPFLIDIAFLYVTGFITAAFGNKITEYAVQLGFLVSSRSGNLTQQYVSSSIPQMMAANPQIASSVYTLILLFSLSSLAAFVLFLSLESFSFWLILKQSGYPVAFGRYFLQFFQVSLVWLAFMVVYWMSSYADSLRFTLSNRTALYTPSPGFLVYLLLVGYFALISYSLIGTGSFKSIITSTFSLGVKKAHLLGALAVSLIALYSVFNLILVFAFLLNQFLGLMLGFALVVPCLIFVRVVMAKGVRKLVGLTSKE
ncbi:MAG TPA: hypothetical protein VJB08_06870 [Candidatus Nanoarchaeia archaeon]|nr:hypothetical protein [Candidatus Nanoarchaeia archaeon]